MVVIKNEGQRGKQEGRKDKIAQTIERLTGVRPSYDHDRVENKRRSTRIKNVIVVAPAYDFFLVEEEGRLENLFNDIYSRCGLGNPPHLMHVETGSECIDTMEREGVDLVIIFNEPADMGVLGFVQDLKSYFPDIPVVVIGNRFDELKELMDSSLKLDGIFTWNGDGRIFLSIVHLIEDKIYLGRKKASKDDSRVIMLIEDSVQYSSSYVHLIYEEIWDLLTHIISDDMTKEEVEKRLSRRPRVVLSTDFEEGRESIESFEKNLICLITDMENSDGSPEGIELARSLKEKRPSLPVIVQSSSKADEIPDDVMFIMKGENGLTSKIKEVIKEAIGPLHLELDEDVVVKDLREIEDALLSGETKFLKRVIDTGELYLWLESMGEYEIRDDIKEALKKKTNPKEEIINVLESHKYKAYSSTVSEYRRETFGPHVMLSRIGGGALGGKARGLAFVSKILSAYLSKEILSNIDIKIPRSIILSTDVFERFLEINDLVDEELYGLSDERIAARFMDGNLPTTVLGDLRAFVRQTRKPLIVRSSGILEDSLIQPFAGIYSSMLLPNMAWDTDFRFQDVCNAVKYVYASTFFESARNYMKSTPKSVGEEKMAVILQEIIGEKYDNYFYPMVSGVARSYNHYPRGSCDPENGIVYLSLGLGKNIVEGGQSYSFCPKHPKSPIMGNKDDLLKNSQTSFFALNLESIYRMVELDEETSVVKLDLIDAEKHGVLKCIASTYVPASDRIYPGIGYDGTRIIDFAPVLVHGDIPLAKAIRLLLETTETALGYPVEIEFVVEFKENCKKAELYVLQVRSMFSKDMMLDIDIGEYKKEEVLFETKIALGNGIMDDINDVVYVKPQDFNMSKSAEAALEVRDLNRDLLDSQKPYLLIGPGRWGSTESWMGLPVRWGDITGARAIVETPVEGRYIEPSQGSHFFQDMVSSNTAYLVTQREAEALDFDWLDGLETVKEGRYVKHVRTKEPLEIRIDGKRGEGVILKGKRN